MIIDNAPMIIENATTQFTMNTPKAYATGTLGSGAGASGGFATISGNFVSVVDGVVTDL